MNNLMTEISCVRPFKNKYKERIGVKRRSIILLDERPNSSCDLGQHYCMFYSSREDQLALITPFFIEGLRNNHQCVYIYHDNNPDELINHFYNYLPSHDIEQALNTGQLQFKSKFETYLRSGPVFDPEKMIEFLIETVEATLEAHFTALTVTGEMSWALVQKKDNFRSLVEYENALNSVIPDLPIVAVCQYGENQFPVQVLTEMIYAHPKVILAREDRLPNWFYDLPGKIGNQLVPSPELFKIMKELLPHFRSATEREFLLTRQNNELMDFAHLIAHDIRNHLSTLKVYLSLLSENTSNEPAILDRSFGEIRKMERFVEKSIELAELGLPAKTTDSLELYQVVLEAEETVLEKTRTSLTILGTSPTIIGDPERIFEIFKNLFENALVHGKASTITVEFTESSTSYSVSTSNDGCPLPPHFTLTSPTYINFGLRLVKKITDAHGWLFYVQSHNPATFCLVIPKKQGKGPR